MSGQGGAATPLVRTGTLLAELAALLGVFAPARFRGRVISGLCTDSRAATPGALFFAVPGVRADGAQYIADAVARGATAVVYERGAVLPAALPATVTLLEVESVRRAKALAAHHFHGHPASEIACVGVTGTKGKTTTAMLLHSILAAADERPTLIGTIEERVFGSAPRAAQNTTPDPLRLAELLAATRDAGGRSCVMEVSSHALDQERTTGIPFRAALFTQLAREHLDYHADVASYRDAKAKLFESLDDDAIAVVNAEDSSSAVLVRRSRARVVTYGMVPGAHVTAEAIALGPRATTFTLRSDREHGGARFPIESTLVGRHNLMNVLAAAATALGLGLEPGAIARGVADLALVPGRLEPVDAGRPFTVLVDYAHTDDSLEKVLGLLRPLTRGRLLVVFGCGGERDRTKRPRMGRVAASLADAVFVTSDNPRSEAPAAIAAEIVASIPGFPDGAPHVAIELDRAVAIAHALHSAQAGDVVLIAGKGHEDYQIVGTQRLPFDDRVVARELLCRLSP